MNPTRARSVLACVALSVAVAALANQPEQPTVAGGGDTNAEQLTIGQPIAGVTSSGGISIVVGFWNTTESDQVSLPGDTNCDALINTEDIEPFVLALTNVAAYQAAFPDCDLNNADINGDGNVNTTDIDPFVALLIGQ